MLTLEQKIIQAQAKANQGAEDTIKVQNQADMAAAELSVTMAAIQAQTDMAIAELSIAIVGGASNV